MGGGDLIKGEAGEQLGSFGQVLAAGFDTRNVGFASGGEGEGCGAGGFKLLLFGTVFGALGRYFFDFVLLLLFARTFKYDEDLFFGYPVYGVFF